MRGKEISIALGTLSRGMRVRKRMGAGTAPLRFQFVEVIKGWCAVRTLQELSRSLDLFTRLIDVDRLAGFL